MALADSGSSGALNSAAIAQYCKDKDHGKCEKHQKKLVHHCKKRNWKGKKCKAEHREIRHCIKKKKGTKKYCKKHAGPIQS